MKRFLFFALLLVAVSACNKETDVKDQTTLTVGECGRPNVSGNNVTICFDALLEDSRCQRNAQCVWQGAAKGRFIFTADGASHTLELATTTLPPDYRQDTVVSGYKIRLVDVTPYPDGSRPIKKAILQVMR